MKRVFLGIIFIFSSQISWARLINLNQEGFASYLSYYGGNTAVGTKPFENEAVAGYVYSESYSLLSGGEFGFFYGKGKAGFRFSIEVLHPTKLENFTVKDTQAQTLYTATSDITGYIPKLGLEIGLAASQRSRWIFLIYGGSATVTLKNDYVLTATGSAAFPGVSDHSVSIKSTGTQYGGAITYESLFNDSTTFFIDLGYRTFNLNTLTYVQALTTFSGTKAQGETVLDSTGLAKTLDLSGYLANVGFRIYMY